MPAKKRMTPVRRRPRVGRKKATRRNRTYRKRSGAIVPIMKQLIPRRCFHKFKYSVTVQYQTSAVATTATFVGFKTSLFAPQVAGGHQPYEYDQWANFYEYARVYGISYQFRVMCDSPNHNISFLVMQNAYTQSTGTDNDLNAELPTCVAKRIIPHYVYPTVIKGYLSNYRVNGMSKKEFIGDASYESLYGANPSKYAVVGFAVSSATASVYYTVQTTLWLYAEIWGDKLQAKS